VALVNAPGRTATLGDPLSLPLPDLLAPAVFAAVGVEPFLED
jgi:hypothetical protein